MIIRAFKSDDIEEVRRIFDKFYSKDIEIPDFITNYLCAYTVVGDDGDIITAGGVRTIAEVCLVTDKTRSPRSRVQALKEVLSASSYIAREFRFEWLNAITDDPIWANQMKEKGFISRGEALQFDLASLKR